MRGKLTLAALLLLGLGLATDYIDVFVGLPSASAGSTTAKKGAAKTQPAAKVNTLPASGAKRGCDLSAPYNAYTQKLQQGLYPKWDAMLVTGKNHVVLEALVGQDGQVSEVTTTSSPSNSQAEEVAKSAFGQMQPLDPLPSGSPAARLIINFDSTYDPHGDANSTMGMKMVPVSAPVSKAQTNDGETGQSQ